jgi:hypothetical protein
MHRMSFIRLCLSGAVVAALPACQSTFARKDTIGYAAGDAIAWNKAIHTVDPWPLSSADTTIPVSGRKVAAAIERYENHGTEPVPGPAPVSLVPVVPLAPGTAK